MQFALTVNWQEDKDLNFAQQLGVHDIVAEVDGLNGKPLAALMDYAAHASVMRWGLFFSADYPGFLQSVVEKVYDGELTVLFANGASGDTKIEWLRKKEDGSDDFAYGDVEDARRWGTVLAGEAIKTFGQIRTEEVSGLRVVSKEVALPLFPLPTTEEVEAELKAKWKKGEDATWEERTRTSLRVETAPTSITGEIQVLHIGPEIMLIAIPGELFAEVGLKMREQVPCKVHLRRWGVISYGGRLWALDRHLIRLRRSLSEIGISGISMGEVREKVIDAYGRSGIPDALVYFQITRGVAPRRHAWGERLKPSFLITVREREQVSEERRERGVRAITLPERRWARRDIKSINLLPNVLAAQRAWEEGAFEAIFVDDQGDITEGAHTNVFAVREGRLQTAAEGPHLLSGITRGLVIEIAQAEGIEVEEGPLSGEVMMEADEVFLTGTGIEVIGVTSIDGRTLGDGKVGPITRRLCMVYMERVEKGLDAP